MPTPVRFHLDENIHGAVANGLRLRGIDVTTARDAGLIGASDEEHLAFALGARRVTVTHDDDFLRLHDQGVPHAGIAYSNPRRRRIGHLVNALVRMWRTESAEQLAGRVEFL